MSWINVKERVPDKNGKYLVSFQFISEDKPTKTQSELMISEFNIDDGFKDCLAPTHWMPLPKKPKDANNHNLIL